MEMNSLSAPFNITSSVNIYMSNISYTQGAIALSAITLISLAVFKYSAILIYQNNLKNREFGKESAQILKSGMSDLVQEQCASEDSKFEVKLIQPKTDFSSYLDITKNKSIKLKQTNEEYGISSIMTYLINEKNKGCLRLIKKGKDLQWVMNLFQNGENKHYTCPAINDISYYETYASEAPSKDRIEVLKQAKRIRELIQERKVKKSDIIEWLRNTPLDYRITYFKDCDLKKLKYSNTGTLFVDVKPRTFTSQYGGVCIDRDNWAVTVVCRLDKNQMKNPNPEEDKDCPYGHSVIIYEGVSKGKQFIHYAHFVENRAKPGVGKVIHITEKILNEKDNVSQSRTWIRRSYWITQMKEFIECMMERQEKEDIFTYSSPGSLLYCMTSFEINKFSNNLKSVLNNLASNRLISKIFKLKKWALKSPQLKLNCHLWIAIVLTQGGIDALSYFQMIASIPTIHTPLLKLKKQ